MLDIAEKIDILEQRISENSDWREDIEKYQEDEEKEEKMIKVFKTIDPDGRAGQTTHMSKKEKRDASRFYENGKSQ